MRDGYILFRVLWNIRAGTVFGTNVCIGAACVLRFGATGGSVVLRLGSAPRSQFESLLDHTRRSSKRLIQPNVPTVNKYASIVGSFDSASATQLNTFLDRINQ
jgi:hypothetical protein